MPAAFAIEALDHVAINVSNMEASVKWYAKVLGLEKVQLPHWGDYPIFMMAGKCGVALFPADLSIDGQTPMGKSVRIDHFAFAVTNQNFALARSRYEELELDYSFQDHSYFHSLYVNDPDGHRVELTTLVAPEEEVYG